MAAQVAKIRLLICAVCKTIEELPWYEGPQEHDDTGNYRVSFHRFPSGNYHAYTVGDVPEQSWKDPRFREAALREITKEVQGLGDAGLGAEFYDLKATFGEDAFACWKQHGKRADCEDYYSDRKKLVPDTRAERKEANSRSLPISPTGPGTYLCQFCPVHSVVVTKQRKARGDYNKQSWE